MTNRRLLHGLLIAGGLALAGCDVLPVGSGRIVADTRSVGAFGGVAIGSGLPAQVSVAGGDAFSLTITGDDNLVGYVESAVANGVLTVRLPDRINFNSRSSVRVDITAPALTSVEADGAALVTANGLAGDSVRLVASGAARLTTFGTANSVDARASGAGVLHAQALTAHDVVVHGDGAADLDVCADAALDLHLSGGSHARYACNPAQVNRDLSGGSSAEAQ